MKTSIRLSHLFFLISVLCPLSSEVAAQAPQLINYQGRLLNGTNLVNGSVALSLRLYDAATVGALLYEDSNSVAVADGLYSTFIGDDTTFGSWSSALTNAQVWLEAAVNNVPLAPRERVASVAYALHAWGLSGNAGTTPGPHFLGTTDSQPLELRVNNQRGLRIEPAGFPNIIGGSSNTAAAGISGAVIGGGQFNTVSNDFAAVGGGSGNSAGAQAAFVGGGQLNSIQANAYSANIAGGQYNTIWPGSAAAAIGGGDGNTIQSNSYDATISGGAANFIQVGAIYSTIGGGLNHGIGSDSGGAVIGGGDGNKIQTNSYDATVAGGAANTVQSFAQYSAIGGGYANTIQQDASLATIGGGAANAIQSSADHANIGGGGNNTIMSNSAYATIGGGFDNFVVANSPYATVGGGDFNVAGDNGTVPGGFSNAATGQYSFAAGYRARAGHDGSFVWAGGISGIFTFPSTTSNQFLIRASSGVGIGTNVTPEMLTVNGNIAPAISNAYTLGNSNLRWAQIYLASKINYASALEFVTSGGSTTMVLDTSGNLSLAGSFSGNAGGLTNITLATNSVTGANIVNGSISNADLAVNSVSSSTILDDTIDFADIGQNGATNGQIMKWNGTKWLAADDNTGSGSSGWGLNGNAGTTNGNFLGTTDNTQLEIRVNNLRAGLISPSNGAPNVVFGAAQNSIAAGARGGAVSGGSNNSIQASADYSSIPGGRDNVAGGSFAFAAGQRALATNGGSFVWADNASTNYTGSISNNSWTVRSLGGARFISGISPGGAMTSGVILASGSGTWTSLSDRNAKKNFAGVDVNDVLEKIAALPVLAWSYKTQDDSIRHIGPMAQDFKAAFGVGESDTGITTVDADGVALAAIQGLYRLVQEQQKQIARLEEELKKR